MHVRVAFEPAKDPPLLHSVPPVSWLPARVRQRDDFEVIWMLAIHKKERKVSQRHAANGPANM